MKMLNLETLGKIGWEAISQSVKLDGDYLRNIIKSSQLQYKEYVRIAETINNSPDYAKQSEKFLYAYLDTKCDIKDMLEKTIEKSNNIQSINESNFYNSPIIQAPHANLTITIGEDKEIRTEMPSSRTDKFNKIINVPFNKNNNFIGRNKDIDKIKNGLDKNNIQTIVGMAGVGKSQLAIEYIYKFKSEYDVIFWINADNGDNIYNGYLDLAKSLNIASKSLTTEEVIRELFLWMYNENWIIILDNVENYSDVVDILPKHYNGHILITSKNPNCKSISDSVNLELFNDDEVNEFYSMRLGENEKSKYTTLGTILGNLPLALEQSTAYIEQCAIDVDSYIKLFDSDTIELLSNNLNETSHNKNLVKSIDLILDKIKEESIDAYKLSQLLCFLDSNKIPKQMIEILTGILDINEAIKVNDMIRILRKYSLISATNKYVSIHCLTQSIIEFSMSDVKKLEYIKVISEYLNDSIDLNINTAEKINIHADLYPHYKRILMHLNNYHVKSNDRILMLVKLSFNMKKIMNLDEALINAKEAYRLTQEYNEQYLLGPIYNLLGGIYKDLGDYSNALKFYNKNLNIKDEDLFLYIVTKNNIGLILSKQSKYKESKIILEECLVNINKFITNDEDEMIFIKEAKLNIISNLALAECNLNNLENALFLNKQSLDLAKVLYDEESILYSREINNKGYILENKGEYEKALENYYKSLDIDKKLFGMKHAEVAKKIMNCSNCLINTEQYDEALDILEDAKEIYDILYNDINHISLSDYYSVLSKVEFHREAYEKAILAIEEAIKIRTKIYDEDLKLSVYYELLGRYKQKLYGLEGSLEYFDKSIDIVQNIYGENSFQNFKIIYDIILELKEYNIKNIPKRYLNKLLKIGIKLNEESHIHALNLISSIYAINENYNDAIRCYNTLINVLDIKLKYDEIAINYSNLASMYSYLDNNLNVNKFIFKAIDIIEQNNVSESTKKTVLDNFKTMFNIEYGPTHKVLKEIIIHS